MSWRRWLPQDRWDWYLIAVAAGCVVGLLVKL